MMFSEISNLKILNLEHGRKHYCFGSNNDNNDNLSTNKYTKELDTFKFPTHYFYKFIEKKNRLDEGPNKMIHLKCAKPGLWATSSAFHGCGPKQMIRLLCYRFHFSRDIPLAGV